MRNACPAGLPCSRMVSSVLRLKLLHLSTVDITLPRLTMYTFQYVVQISAIQQERSFLHDGLRPLSCSTQTVSYPPVDKEGGNLSGVSPHATSISSVNVNSTVDPFSKTSHSRKQFDFHGVPSIVTFCESAAK